MGLNSPQAQEEASLASRQGHTPPSLRASPGFSLLLMWLLLLTRGPAAPWTYSPPPPQLSGSLSKSPPSFPCFPHRAEPSSHLLLPPHPHWPPPPTRQLHLLSVSEATLPRGGRTWLGQPRPLRSRPGRGKSLILGPPFTAIHMPHGSAAHP